MNLTTDQQLAADSFMDFIQDEDETMMLVRGSAGVGKSFLIEHFINLAQKKKDVLNMIMGAPVGGKVPVRLTATTNKAVAVLDDLGTGYECETIYKMLGLTVKNNYENGTTFLAPTRQTRDVREHLIFIDEAGFLNKQALNMCLKYLKNCKIVFLYDPYQLLSPKTDHCPVNMLQIRKVDLNQVVRNSGIIMRNSESFKKAIVTKQMPEIEIDGIGARQLTREEFAAEVMREFVPQSTNKILCWTNKQCKNYAAHIRKLRSLPTEFTVGEKVILNTSNGSTGLVTDSEVIIRRINDAKYMDMDCKHVLVEGHNGQSTAGYMEFKPAEYKAKQREFKAAKEWHEFFELRDATIDLRARESMTVHKSQGSTYEEVYIDLEDICKNNNKTEMCRLLYVGNSRAKVRVNFYGELK